MREGFIGVHIGAGQHSEARTEIYLETCTEACRVGTDILRNGGTALEAACAATVVLENASDTNAGYGSNLTESGTVEMDAGVMDGSSLIFGAVGAVPGIKNPIIVAKMLVQEQQNGLLPLGRVPPGFLVGEGARDWAVRHGLETVPTESLISEKADKLYRHYKKKLDHFRSTFQSQVKRNHHVIEESSNGPGSSNDEPVSKKIDTHALDDGVTDTVGVVVLDKCGNIASTVSSGGIALKQPGRVGQAPCYGCGCWAKTSRRNEDSSNGFTVGVSTTGCGEHLVRTLLARECATELSKTDKPFQSLQKVMKEKFVESEFLVGVPEKLGGAICLHYDEMSGTGEFLWTHTTSSMGLAFQATNSATATTRMSRLPATSSTNPPTNATFISIESASFSTLPSNRIVNQGSPTSQSDVLVTQDGKLYRIVPDQQDKRILQATTTKA